MSALSLVHQLSLDIPTTANPRIFRVDDTSIYTPDLPIICPLLQITPPGFSIPTNITVTTSFNLVLNACTLGIQSADCGNNSYVLPDGIYILRYSVSPNDKVFVEYHHMRVTQFVNRYNQMLCSLELNACEPSADIKAQLTELRLIKSFIDAAKAKVEDCHDDHKGMELLDYARRKLMKLDTNFC